MKKVWQSLSVMLSNITGNGKVLQKAGIRCTSAQLKLNLINKQTRQRITSNPAFCNTRLCEVLSPNKLNNYENMEYRNASLKPTNQRITLG